MLGEAIYYTPDADDEAVEELLASSCSLQPHLADQQKDDEDDPVRNESASHDEMRETLSSMVCSAKSESCDASKEKLYPSHYW